jgi:hypothetical protein
VTSSSALFLSLGRRDKSKIILFITFINTCLLLILIRETSLSGGRKKWEERKYVICPSTLILANQWRAFRFRISSNTTGSRKFGVMKKFGACA